MACCNTNASPVSMDYSPKGSYETYGGLKCYVTGPANPKKVILAIYDIFGYSAQSFKGADYIADCGNLVVMPDFFGDKKWPISKFPPTTDEEKAKFGEFFGTVANPQENGVKVNAIGNELAAKFPEAKLGCYGLCWGGKVITLMLQNETVFKVAGSAHPAHVDPNDAPGLTCPFLLMPSKDEPKDSVDAFEEALKKSKYASESYVHWYPDVLHGFMAARMDPKNELHQKRYAEGYKELCDFLCKHLA